MPDLAQPQQPQQTAPAIVFDLIRGEVSEMTSTAAAQKLGAPPVATSGLPLAPRP